MGVYNTSDEYGSIAKWFHWLVAFGVIIMLLLGLSFGYVHYKPAKIILITLHKSIGLTIFVLMVLRLLWRWANITPRFPSSTPSWQRLAARWSHGLLYFVVIIMPLDGLAMSTAGGHTTNFWWFWQIRMPWVPKSKELGNIFGTLHATLAWVLAALIIIHVCGALKHHFINRDNVLKRIYPKREPKYFR